MLEQVRVVSSIDGSHSLFSYFKHIHFYIRDVLLQTVCFRNLNCEAKFPKSNLRKFCQLFGLTDKIKFPPLNQVMSYPT